MISGMLSQGPSFVRVCSASEQEVLPRPFFVAACRTSGAVQSPHTLEVLVDGHVR